MDWSVSCKFRVPRILATPLVVLGIAGWQASPALALTINGPELLQIALRKSCRDPGETVWLNCYSSGFFSTSVIGGTDAEFRKGFDAWNALQPDDMKWSLVDGGGIDGTLVVSVFAPKVEMYVGGMDFVTLWDYEGDDKASYFWSQSLKINYRPGPLTPTVPSFHTLDTASFSNFACVGIIFCDPLYPFQYENRLFGDIPRGPWPDADFEARAMLSKADEVTRVLTVYQGIRWGFFLTATPVPEPETWLLFIAGFGAVGFAVRRRNRRFQPG